MKVKVVPLLAILLTAASCTGEKNNQRDINTYFDLKGYFAGEAAKLADQKPEVQKSAAKNLQKETKQLVIRNWRNEFELFTESDINKPAWKNSYQITAAKNVVTYTAKEPALRTRNISIERDQHQKIKHISILNRSSNYLYSSAEQLDYYPDSVYLINKKQDVILIGRNDYYISGRIIK